ncbi:hypothetical protein J6590_056413 [Homalodisca vitripennis]|nr:hypothetical protein J6590_056413 [Homalodisca vitripennis]
MVDEKYTRCVLTVEQLCARQINLVVLGDSTVEKLGTSIINVYLEKNSISDLSRNNFSFSSKAIVGEFIHCPKGGEPKLVSEQEILDTLADLKVIESLRLEAESGKHEKEKLVIAAKEAKKAAKEEAARTKELTRFIKEQEKSEKQEAIRKEREQRSIQMLEVTVT